jgi:hypothetical protein
MKNSLISLATNKRENMPFKSPFDESIQAYEQSAPENESHIDSKRPLMAAAATAILLTAMTTLTGYLSYEGNLPEEQRHLRHFFMEALIPPGAPMIQGTLPVPPLAGVKQAEIIRFTPPAP